MTLISAVMLLGAGPVFETFTAPGYEAPVAGVWYGPQSGEASSPIPLGALGTGFVELTSAGAFGAATTENSWLRPKPASAGSGLLLGTGDGAPRPLAEVAGDSPSRRFWGHFPAADLELGSVDGIETRVRAFAPLLPHDYDTSSMPVTFYRYTVTNTRNEPARVQVGVRWGSTDATTAEGNVEGALGWRKEALAPGETWQLTPTLEFVYGTSIPVTDIHAVAPTPAPEGHSYAAAGIEGFLLDEWAGFNWETHKRGSGAGFGNEKTNIGQVFWQVSHGGARAGRGFNGAYGFSGDGLPATTKDGALEVSSRVLSQGMQLAIEYNIKNVSPEIVRDLRFGFAVNVDEGGQEGATNDRVSYQARPKAIEFEGPSEDASIRLYSGLADLLQGSASRAGIEADEFCVGNWPAVHEAMERGEMTPIGTTVAAGVDTPLTDESGKHIGLCKARAQGSYAVGVGGDGWTVSTPGTGAEISAVGERTLQPGETAEAVVALAWYFPEWTSSDGEAMRHRYAKDYRDAGEVLRVGLKRAGEVEKKIVDWQSKVYAAEVPASLKDALINGLYVLARNSWWTDDGRFFQSESFTGCPITETFVCRFNGSFPLALMWPELEKATMREVAKFQGENGQIPFGFGTPLGSRTPMMELQVPIVSTEYALTVWRNHELWKDDAYLREAYPSAKKALQFAMTLDQDGDGLVNDSPGNEEGFPANQYYDIWPWWGTSAYVGSISLAAWRAGEEMARLQGDEAFAQELRGWYDRGSKAFQDKLWTGAYYRLYSGDEKHPASDTSLTNALCGQWFAYASGLGEFLPRERIESTIDNVLRLNAAATSHGAVNGVTPDGRPDMTFEGHSAVITIGEVWNFCAMAASAGRKEEAVGLFDTSYGNVALRQNTPWNIPWCLNRDTGAIQWGIHYYSNPCVWTLLRALDPKAYAAFGR